MKIKSALKEYEVVTETDSGFVRDLMNTSESVIVVDRNVFNLYNSDLGLSEDEVILFDATEDNKVMDTVLDICAEATNLSAKRNATIISIGGGITQDVTGFVASVLYRGIQWEFVPTTLLASCDSCIGGKTSINFKSYKNLLGTFYPPDRIHIWTPFFESLSEKDYLSGLGEVLKFNIMQGENGLSKVESAIDDLIKRKTSVVAHFVESSLIYKKRFIEQDEFDRGERIKLNFAHTFGHAIEVLSEYKIPHGTAVAVGMIMADSISENRGILSSPFVRRSESVLLRIIDIDPNLLNADKEQILSVMRKDKKQTGREQITAVLRDNQKLNIIHDLSPDEVQYAFEHFMDIYS